MYAVFQLSGFQFRAEEGAVLRVPRQTAGVGDIVDISDVLLLKNNDSALVGTPTVQGAKIEAEVIAIGKADKEIVYKFKRRTKYRLTQGHRQGYTDLKIKKIISPKE